MDLPSAPLPDAIATWLGAMVATPWMRMVSPAPDPTLIMASVFLTRWRCHAGMRSGTFSAMMARAPSPGTARV